MLLNIPEARRHQLFRLAEKLMALLAAETEPHEEVIVLKLMGIIQEALAKLTPLPSPGPAT